MKERPILFNAEMVQAILSGRKTQTRRVIRDQPFDRSQYRHDHQIEIVSGRAELGDEIDGLLAYSKSSGGEWHAKCPLGQPGDQLWVRETFATLCNEDGCAIDWQENLVKNGGPDAARIYRASCEQKPGNYGLWSIPDIADWKPHTWNVQYEGSWVPSIHMPRWASRINLLITSVRVERLRDIKEEDAGAEGVSVSESHDSIKGFGQAHGITHCPKISAFANLWQSIYGTWEENPWVWVIEFKRIGGDL